MAEYTIKELLNDRNLCKEFAAKKENEKRGFSFEMEAEQKGLRPVFPSW